VSRRDRRRPRTRRRCPPCRCRAQLVIGGVLRERGEEARVQPTGEVGPDRHVRAQAQAHAVAHELVELLRGAARVRRRVLRPPPGPLGDDVAVLPHEQAACAELVDVRKRRARSARPPQREDVVDPLEVRIRADLARGEQALGLGGEHEAAVGGERVVQRPHPEAVAHERQPALTRLPPRERELPVEAIQRGEPVALEHLQDDLRVGQRRGDDPVARELDAQLRVVVDLAVVDDERAAVGADRLPSAGYVEDRQPRRHEPRAGAGRQAVAVRAAMAQRGGHAPQRRLVDRGRRIASDDAPDAAHLSRRS